MNIQNDILPYQSAIEKVLSEVTNLISDHDTIFVKCYDILRRRNNKYLSFLLFIAI